MKIICELLSSGGASVEGDVARDMGWSKKLFEEQVWPACAAVVGGGELLQMEGRPDSALARLLDMRAGVDGWQITTDGMRGIASRIQVTVKPWNSFTIRMRRDSGATTEYDKRKAAIEGGGWLFPFLTVQAYAATCGGPILSWAVARTGDIIRFIRSGLHSTNRTSNAVFAVCYWSDMARAGYRVKVWMAEK